jgi:subfamily B ATP-binding cassette protein HlyB/CyaB
LATACIPYAGKRSRHLQLIRSTNSGTSPTAEQFAHTVNQLKGKVTMLFIAHQLPRGLAVDEVFTLTAEKAKQMRVVENDDTSES